MKLLLALIVVAVGFSAGASAADVAVFPIGGRAPARDRADLSAALRNEVSGLGMSVLSTTQTEQVVADAAAIGTVCDVVTPACALQLGGLAGVRIVIVGTVDQTALTLRSFNVATEREGAKATVPLGAVGPTAKLAATRLLRPDLAEGTLVVDVDVAGATISVDGRVRGRSPLGPISVAAGRHEVYVGHVDHQSQTIPVSVGLGAVTTIEVTLSDAVARPRHRPSTSTGEQTLVYVLDVVVDGYEPIVGALATEALVEEITKRDDLTVVSPMAIARLAGRETMALLAGCTNDACRRTRLSDRFKTGDLVLVDIEAIGTGARVSARRLSLEGGAEPTAVDRIIPVAPRGREPIEAVGPIVAELYPASSFSREIGVDEALLQRVAPPPVAPGVVVAAAGVGVVGAVLAGTGFGLANAWLTEDTTVAAVWGAVGTAGVVAAGVGFLGALAMAPVTDWSDVAGENAALLEETADRRHTRP